MIYHSVLIRGERMFAAESAYSSPRDLYFTYSQGRAKFNPWSYPHSIAIF